MIVIGNGTSRTAINLESYPETKIGCNAIFRDIYVDHLVCCDKKMVKQALSSGTSPVYTRQRWIADFPSEDVIALPDLPYNGDKRQDDPFHWGSGPYALLLATTMSKYIKIVGFDLYGTKDGNTNNVYASTDGYKTKQDDAVDWSYWVYQIAKLFEHNKDTTFHFFNLENWKCPKQWNFKNIKVDNINKL